MKSGFKTLIFYIVIIVAVIGLSVLFMGTEAKDKPVYSDIISYFENNKKEIFVIQKSLLIIKLKTNFSMHQHLIQLQKSLV